MARTRRILLPFILLLVLSCTQYEYLVEEPDAPLFATPRMERVIARMPQYHHERIDELTDQDPVAIRFLGREGFTPRGNLSFFSYPVGAFSSVNDQHQAARRAVRDAILRDKEWPPHFEAAIREDRVRIGMTREMVELALGPPEARLPGEGAASRWVYSHLTYHAVEHWAPGWYWHPTLRYEFGYGRRSRFYYGSHLHFGPRYYVDYHPVRVEQHLYFGADGLLDEVEVRQVPE